MDSNWVIEIELSRMKHQEMIADSEEWNRERRTRTAENEERAQRLAEETRAHLQGRGASLEMLGADREEAAG